MQRTNILKNSLVVMLMGSALMLSACSEDRGWVAVEHKGGPYAQGRTIGTGIKYVRAFMLDEKGPALDPIMQEVDALLHQHEKMTMPAQSQAIESAEPIFSKKLKK